MKNKFLQFLSSMRRGAAMLLLLLTGVTHAWAAESTVKGGHVYFDAGGSGWSVDNVQYVVGHSGYSTGYGMAEVTNTLLYYYSSPSWNDASYFAFASGTSSWGAANQAWSSRCGWATKSTTEKGSYTLNSGNVYVFKSDGTGTCDGVVSDSPYGHLGSTGYSDLNKTVTIRAKVSTDGGSTYSNANTPGALTASSYKFSAYGTCGTQDATTSASLSKNSSTATFTAGYTANTSVTAADAEDYTFMGWYEGSTKVLDGRTGTMNPHGAVTLYAYYKKDLWTVAGSEAVMGVDWDPTSATNDMTKVATNTYTLTKKNVKLTSGTTYRCKVVRDHDSGYGEAYPGSDKTFSVSTTGYYDVTFTFNTSTHAVTVTTVLWDAASVYSGSATINITLENIASSKSLEYKLYAGESAAGDPLQTVSTTTTTTSHSQSFSVTPSFGASDINKKYTLKVTYDGIATTYTNVVGRKWDIYVHDVQSWGGVKQHHWGNYGSSDYPGAACSQYKSPSTWYTVTIDGKYNTGFVLSKSSDNTKKTVDLTPSITTYPAGSYWYISYVDSKFGLTTAGTVVAPTVTLTVDKVNVNQITVTGTVTNCGGDGTTAADMKEVGFKVNGTTYAATYKSGTSFKKTITGLTANTDISIKAYATNIIGTSESAAKDTTTYANTTYRVKVRVASGATAPKVYAWTDADAYGGSKMENGTYKSQSAATLLFAATEYDWYYSDLNNCYENFLIYTTGDGDKSQDFPATRVSDCYWYNAGASAGSRASQMDCPVMTTNLYFGDKDAAAGDHVYHLMSGTTTMTKTLSLAANSHYEFKIVYNTEFYGIDSKTVNRDGKTNNVVSAGTAAVNGAYIYLNTDLAGDYTVTFNESTKAVSVTYPEAYVMTYSAVLLTGSGTACSAPSAATSASVAVSSGDIVLDGTSMTFTAAAANTGYTFHGWYDTATPTIGTTTPLSSDDDADKNKKTYTVTVNDAAITVYAVYTENMHDVTVNAQTGGTVSYNGGAASSSCTANAGISTASANIVATAAAGYYFVGWQLPDGTITKATESDYNGATSTYTIHATADSKTVTALFNVRYALLGSTDASDDVTAGMPGWGSNNEAPFTYSAGTYTKTVDLTVPNVNYKFRIVDRRGASHTSYGLSSKAVIHADGNYHDLASTAADAQLATAGVGTYTLTVQTNASGYPKVMISNPTSYVITMKAQYATIGQISSEATIGTTGGTITAVDGEATPNTIVDGKYVKAGGSVTFTATPTTPGYELYKVAGTTSAWYQKPNATKEYRPATYNADSTQLTLSGLDKDTAVYVIFKEKSTKVYIPYAYGGDIKKWNGSAWDDLAGYSQYIGVTTTLRIKAVPREGYYFKEWRKVGSDFTTNHDGALNNEDNYDLTLTGAGAGEQEGDTLEPIFAPLEEIYFYNTNGDAGRMDCGAWSDVYVYFDITWNDGKVTTSSNSAYRVKMDNSLEMHAYVPRAYTRWLDSQPAGTHGKVAFSNKAFGTSTEFNSGYAASRGDYVKKMNMFKPRTTKKSSAGGVDYYDDGYWWPEDVETKEGVGYYLKKSNGDQIGEFLGAYKYASYAEISYRIDQPNQDVKFYITSAGGETYKLYNKYTGRDTIYNSEMVRMSLKEGAADGFQIHTTSEGEYKFTIQDGVGGWLWLSVEYPISKGDYRLVHSYNGRNKNNSADSVYYTYSDVIKATKAGNNNRLSMYLSNNKGNSSVASTIKLQKCTGTPGGNPTWSAGQATNLGDILTKLASDGNGVYQFDITSIKAADSTVNGVDSIRLYEGSYYIKTDCAPGGWSNYTRNTMNMNTMNPTAFDNYFIQWIENNSTNVKCVIANDYCNQLSDTLKSDALLYRNSTWYETLPCASNVRFSYNSKTNELKRSYLLGSTMSQKFVTLVPNEEEYVYSAATDGTDYYSSNPEFSDNGNWTYQIDAYVYPGAKAGVKTTYPDNEPKTTVYMIPTTNSLMGGTKGEGPRYHVRLVYDFKTEYLMSAYIPDGETVEESINLNTDLMYVRTGTGSGTQLSFSGDGELKNVHHAYGVFQFPKDEMYEALGNSWSDNDYQAYKYCRYYFSFPFDVKVSDIFGVGKMNQDWIIQHYNGAKRAEYGWFMETETFWEEVAITDTLKANHGYSLSLDRTVFNYGWNGVWTNIPEHGYTYLYFPSMSATIGDIKATSGTHTVPALPCNIDREFSGKSHKNTDSNWTLFGVPAYADMKLNDDALTACYIYNPEGNTWTLDENLAESDPVFQSMHAYMVQWAGTFSWIQYVPEPVAPDPAPARRTAKKSNTVHLELTYDGIGIDRTYVRLKEGTDAGFVLNEDGYKLINKNQSNIYAFAGAYEVGMSQVPVENQTVPVGVIIRRRGTYTFSMPERFDGTAILVDKFDGTRINLSQEDYEVYLEKGTFNDRFELVIDINKVPTSIEGVDGSSLKDSKAYKFFENGSLYIMENGRIYDARGNRVK